MAMPPVNEQKFFTRHERGPFAALGGFSSVVESERNAAREVAKENDVDCRARAGALGQINWGS